MFLYGQCSLTAFIANKKHIDMISDTYNVWCSFYLKINGTSIWMPTTPQPRLIKMMMPQIYGRPGVMTYLCKASPLVTNSDDSSDDDDSSFVTASRDFSEDEMPTPPQMEACNVTKLKITTLVEGRQPHS